MSLSNFNTPSPIAVALDLYDADVRLVVSDRADTIVDVRPGDPDKAADVKAAENTRVEYDGATRTLSIVSRKPRSRFVNFSSKGRPESIDVIIRLPSDSDVRGEADLGDFVADGVLGAVAFKTGLGAVHLDGTGPLNLRNGLGQVSVADVRGSAEVHAGSGDIRIRAVDGTAFRRSPTATGRYGSASSLVPRPSRAPTARCRSTARCRTSPRRTPTARCGSARSCAARCPPRPRTAASRSASARAAPPGWS